jgi:hypothetical protein
LDNLPKLKYKKKDKHRQKRRSKVTGASFSAEVDEPDIHDDTSIDLDKNIGDYETTSAVGTVTPEVVKYTKSHKYLLVTARNYRIKSQKTGYNSLRSAKNRTVQTPDFKFPNKHYFLPSKCSLNSLNTSHIVLFQTMFQLAQGKIA